MASQAKGKILVIEDDDGIVFGLTQLLELEGYQVSTAPNGAVALDLLKAQGLPDLILLDMLMPVMNGWEFAAEFSKLYGKAVPVLVMTAAANAEDRAKDVGALGFVPKPFRLEQLLERISAVLE